MTAGLLTVLAAALAAAALLWLGAHLDDQVHGIERRVGGLFRQFLHPAHERQHREPDPFAWMAAEDAVPPAQAALPAPLMPGGEPMWTTPVPLADQTIPVARVGAQPWETAGQTAVTAEVEQRMRDEYFGRHARREDRREPACGEAPQAEVQERGRTTAPQDTLHPVNRSVSAWRPDAVTAEGERLASVIRERRATS